MGGPRLKVLPLPGSGVCVGTSVRRAQPAVSPRGACVRARSSPRIKTGLFACRGGGVYTHSHSRIHTAAHATLCHWAGEKREGAARKGMAKEIFSFVPPPPPSRTSPSFPARIPPRPPPLEDREAGGSGRGRGGVGPSRAAALGRLGWDRRAGYPGKELWRGLGPGAGG